MKAKEKVRAGARLKVVLRNVQEGRVTITLGGRKLGSVRIDGDRVKVWKKVPGRLKGKKVLRVLDRHGDLLARTTVRVMRKKR